MRLPDDFDREDYDVINAKVPTGGDPPRLEWKGFAAGWNGVAHRFRAAATANDRLVESITRAPFPGIEERHVQEEALFSFFVNAVSVYDCLYFALYYAGAIEDPAHFPTAKRDLRKFPRDVVSCFGKAWPTDRIVRDLGNGLDLRDVLAEYRDFLAHRGCLPRHDEVNLGGPDVPATIPENPKDRPVDWILSVPLLPATIRFFRDELAAEVKALLAGARYWVTRRFG